MECTERNTELIGAYVDGMATAPQKRALEAHLAECESCAREVRELVHIREAVSALPDLTPSPSLMPALSSKLREQRVGWLERLFWSARPSTMRAPIAIAACLIVCVAVGIFAVNGPGTVEPVVATDAVARAPVTNHTEIYQPPVAVVERTLDEYEENCALTHAASDHGESYYATESVMFARFARD